MSMLSRIFCIVLLVAIWGDSASALQPKCSKLQPQVRLVRKSVKHPAKFCTFYLARTRSTTAIPKISAGKLADSCKCILRAAKKPIPKTKKADAKPAVKQACRQTFVASIKKEFVDSKAFCKFYNANSQSQSPVSGLNVKQLAQGCQCIISPTRSKTTSTRKSTVSSTGPRKDKVTSTLSKASTIKPVLPSTGLSSATFITTSVALPLLSSSDLALSTATATAATPLVSDLGVTTVVASLSPILKSSIISSLTTTTTTVSSSQTSSSTTVRSPTTLSSSSSQLSFTSVSASIPSSATTISTTTLSTSASTTSRTPTQTPLTFLNPSFESSGSSTAAAPANWTWVRSNGVGKWTAATSGSPAQDGIAFVRFSLSPGTDVDEYVRQTNISVTPATAYKLSYWARLNNFTQGASGSPPYMVVNTGTAQNRAFPTLNAAGIWIEDKVDFATDSAQTTLDLRIGPLSQSRAVVGVANDNSFVIDLDFIRIFPA